jgi:GAF domain/Pyridoxamine 5'-phosphate oxidase
VSEPVALESISACFRGVIPSPFATCSPDGVPNITYMSIVQYVDSERVALSRQFFNKTRANLDANPVGQVRVVDPDTLDQYELDLEFLHTETHGPTFDTMRANLDAIASQSGMGAVFRLRGVDIHRVTRCARVGPATDAQPSRSERDMLGPLDEFTRQLAACADYDEASRVALDALEDLFGFAPSVLLVREPDADRLFAVATNGYPRSGAGAEVPLGAGVIGTAASTGQVICVSNVTRSRVMQAAVRSRMESHGNPPAKEIPLPGLDQVSSVAAAPLQTRHAVTGVLYLESERVGRFGPHNDRLLRIIGRHLAAALGALGSEGEERDVEELASAEPAVLGEGEPLSVTYYQADDSVFVDDVYVIKGAAGRILWKMLREHAETQRSTFTNRELRLDESLGLPAGADNLEARLLVLRKRLAGGRFAIGLERVGRGRLALHSSRPLKLSDVPTSGVMSNAYPPPSIA